MQCDLATMSATAIILIIISAGMHAAWNYVGKSRRPSVAFFLAATALGTACFLPILVFHHAALTHIPTEVWGLLDGKRSVRELIAVFADRHRMHPKEAEFSVARFLRELGRRGLIGLR